MSVRLTAQRRKLLGEIERLADMAIFGTLSETYRTCGRAGCHCQRRWIQAWSASEYQLPWGEGQDHRLLCSQRGGGSYAGRSSRLAKTAGVFARAGRVE